MRIIAGLLVFILSVPTALANVVGIDTQLFNPTYNGLDFVTVQSSETLEPGIFNFGYFLNYSANSLPRFNTTGVNQGLENLDDQLLSHDLSIGLGLTRGWDIGVTIPYLLWQEVDESPTNSGLRGLFESTGVTEIRAASKVRFLGDASGGIGMVGSMNYFLVENYPFTGTDPDPTFNVELVGDFTWGPVNLGANVGYRFRAAGNRVGGIPVEPTPDQVIFSLAGSYLISSIDTKFIAEAFASVPMEQVSTISDRQLSSAEALLGLKWDMTNYWAWHIGAGTELYHGSASPDLRAYLGVNIALGPAFGKQYESYEPAQLLPTTREDDTVETPSVAFIDEVDFSKTPTKGKETFIAKDVLFEFNSSKVNEDFYPILKQLADYLLKGNGFKSLTITGHTDSVGSDSYNLKLSVRRSSSVKRYLNQILPKSEHHKVIAKGKGEREPIADNGNYQGRALNRRVEFTIER